MNVCETCRRLPCRERASGRAIRLTAIKPHERSLTPHSIRVFIRNNSKKAQLVLIKMYANIFMYCNYCARGSTPRPCLGRFCSRRYTINVDTLIVDNFSLDTSIRYRPTQRLLSWVSLHLGDREPLDKGSHRLEIIKHLCAKKPFVYIF